MITAIRKFLWRVLGVSYGHIVKVTDRPYLKNDPFTTKGVGTYDNNACVYRWSDAPLKIGAYCAVSYGVKFIMDDGGHTTDAISSYPFKGRNVSCKEGITVGNDVWIGMNAVILYGVTLGDGATIAAGAVVTEDVPPYTIVGGVPAKIIREKCTREEASQMQTIAWWNWPKETIDSRLSDFNLSYRKFIAKYGK